MTAAGPGLMLISDILFGDNGARASRQSQRYLHASTSMTPPGPANYAAASPAPAYPGMQVHSAYHSGPLASVGAEISR